MNTVTLNKLNITGVEEVKERLRSKYNKLKVKLNLSDKEDEEGEEKALAARFKKQFKGRCQKCGKWGHKSADCRGKTEEGENKNKEQKPKFKGDCHYCGKTGHRAADCFKKKADEASKAEATNVAAEVSSSEEEFR